MKTITGKVLKKNQMNAISGGTAFITPSNPGAINPPQPPIVQNPQQPIGGIPAIYTMPWGGLPWVEPK
ncbi:MULTISPECIES: hypothetical protein [unclassified Chryseobacterium]|uniref:hypothetical protein n=1 Tax=unclassified Chryseobacterium TaxID=2593645 RepID=UPI0006456126|nr:MULTISPECIES: hypothetical protein [unclassified Chryseobacterium]SHG88418.1 hypothetical protein SAMN02787100_4869 [Chryseobacterium sp. OV279]HCA09952.1 hypothetical protein [Chryseobacterium sp.]